MREVFRGFSNLLGSIKKEVISLNNNKETTNLRKHCNTREEVIQLMILLQSRVKLNTEQYKEKDSKQHFKLEQWKEEEINVCQCYYFSQVKADNTSENLVNEIQQVVYFGQSKSEKIYPMIYSFSLLFNQGQKLVRMCHN